jgi:hypothetical protein
MYTEIEINVIEQRRAARKNDVESSVDACTAGLPTLPAGGPH